MPAPRWFFRFVYDRESTALARRHSLPESRALVERTVDALAEVVRPPGPVADLGCGPGPHARALARRGYEVVGLDGSPRMIEAARAQPTPDGSGPTFDVHDVSTPLPFADASLGAALAVLVVQHLRDPAAFVVEIRRCLRPGGHLLVTAPTRRGVPLAHRSLYWRLRAAFYEHVPGVVRFSDATTLARLVETGGMTAVRCDEQGRQVAVLARAPGGPAPGGGATAAAPG